MDDPVTRAWWAFQDALILEDVAALERLPELEQSLSGLSDDLVLAARAAGRSWQKIADARGCTKQAAWERYGWVDAQLEDEDALPQRHRRDRYLERYTTVTCTECAANWYSTRGDTASISAKIIRPHDTEVHQNRPTDPRSIADAKDELRRGHVSARAGRYLFATSH